MPIEVVTGNYAAGYALAVAGEANREGKGVAAGIYPITPQTEIVEYVSRFKFTKGRIIPVESEHSAMAVSIGASVAGARAFTASSSNGLMYMTENIFTAGFYRLPIVLVAVNRTLGPPWNIWSDQGDTLLMRDAPLLQFYCEDNQEVLDTILLAFRIAEDPKVLLPVIVTMDAFITSHTLMNTDLPEQSLVDKFLPICRVPHAIDHRHPNTIGGLAWPQETVNMRREVDRVFQIVPEVFETYRSEFIEIFGRDPGGMIAPHYTDDAEIVLLASGSIASTVRDVVEKYRRQGKRYGMIKVKMFRPFPAEEIAAHLPKGAKVGVLDRNYGSAIGGIFCHELRAALFGKREDLLIQGYLTGVGGGDVTPQTIEGVIQDLVRRERAESHIWTD